MQITTKIMYASKVQKAGMIQALRQSSLSGSDALKYNWTYQITLIISTQPEQYFIEKEKKKGKHTHTENRESCIFKIIK